MNEPPKHNIYLCQVNNQYGNNVFLPNSVGMLQAYCLTIDKIKECFDFKGFLYLCGSANHKFSPQGCSFLSLIK